MEKGKRWEKKYVVTGYIGHCNVRPTARALVSYLVYPFLMPPVDWVKGFFRNYRKAKEIPRALNELGYAVDIVSYRNLTWFPSVPYDLFIGHGGINFERISRHLPGRTVRIYFSSGIYWRELNDRVLQRSDEMASRRGDRVSFLRTVDYEEDYALSHSDGIICLGNSNATKTYSRFPKVVGINNTVDCKDWDGWRSKDYTEGRRHFLFFSGSGNVLKGLDLLLEVFSGIDLHLHVCQQIEADFFNIYRNELTEHQNIHLHGHIRVGSREFKCLMRRCNWVIAPTCAEGQPGAVLECMAYGLIPIISEATNITVGDWGVELPDCRIETIRSRVMQTSNMDVNSCRYMAERVYEVSRNDYSAEKFRLNFKRAVEKIVAFSSVQQTPI